MSQQGKPATPLPTLHLTRSADAATIDRLVTLVNALPGSVTSMGFISCPAILGPPPFDNLTFDSSAGTIVSMHLEPACVGQVAVTVDGQKLDTSLDPGTLESLLDEIDPLVGPT